MEACSGAAVKRAVYGQGGNLLTLGACVAGSTQGGIGHALAPLRGHHAFPHRGG